jgi:hypothetical protein
MDSTELTFIMLCYVILDAALFQVRARKARITHDRAAALARLDSYDPKDFRKRSFIICNCIHEH